MGDDTFSVKSAWNVAPPCYVRKVDAAGHWPLDDKPEPERIDKIEREVFGLTSGPNLSVFLIRSSRDLRRVVVGLAARSRQPGHAANIRLVAITSAELGNIRKSATHGNTWCKGANQFHYDLVAPDSRSLRLMIQRMLAEGRKSKMFTKSKVKVAIGALKEQGCYAADPDSTHCDCEDEKRRRTT